MGRREFKKENHIFWGNFNPDTSCAASGSRSVNVGHECCGGVQGDDVFAYHWIGLNKHQCCAGRVKDVNEQC